MSVVLAMVTFRIVNVSRFGDCFDDNKLAQSLLWFERILTWLVMVKNRHCCREGKHEEDCWTLRCFYKSSSRSRQESDPRSSVKSIFVNGLLAHGSPRDSDQHIPLVSAVKFLALSEVRGLLIHYSEHLSCWSMRNVEFLGSKVRETNAPWSGEEKMEEKLIFTN